MKSFLSSLRTFAQGTGGLVVVVVLAVYQTGVINLFSTPFTFSLGVLGAWLNTLLVAFAIIWAQMKGRALLSHLLLFLIFANALNLFLTSVWNALGGSIDGLTNLYMYLGLVAMLYTLGVVVAELVEGSLTPSPLKYEDLFSLGLFAIAMYVGSGWSTTLLSLVPIFIALLLGSKMVAFLYAAASLAFNSLNSLGLAINTPNTMSLWIFTILYVAALVFIVLDLLKAFKNQEA